MSYKSDLQQNNTDLQAILDAINALPDAAGGTATVTVTSNCVGIDGDTAMIRIISPEQTWQYYAYDMPDCTHEIPTGSTIECVIDDSKASNRCYVEVNGTKVLTAPGTYNYTITGDVTVHVADEYSMGEYGTIIITEG